MTIMDLLRPCVPALSVGAISAELGCLAADYALLESCGVRLLHFDVMDGVFAPQLTFGPAFVKAARTAMLKDVHLMVDNPLPALDAYAAAGADIITVQAESGRHVHRVLQRIGELNNANGPGRGIARGIALNPGTPMEALAPLIDEADIVTILAVNPGFAGQKFIPAAAGRVAQARELMRCAGRSLLLCIDGGVTRATMPRVAACAPDIVVTGSAAFENRAIADNIKALGELLEKGRPHP
jgi:ribulose-phosphate 3-epimerase